MWSDNANLSDIASVEATMNQLVRIPYTNAWRIGQIHHDCFSCTVCKTYPKKLSISKERLRIIKKFIFFNMSHVVTKVPASSGSNGIKISNMLEAAGKSVIGWDIEWPVNWSTNRLKIGGAAMYGKIDIRNTKVKVFSITNFKTISKYLLYQPCRNVKLVIYYSHQEK